MPKRILDKLSFPARIGISVGGGALFALGLCLVFALAATLSEDPAKNLTLYGEICFLVSMLFCGFLGAKMGDGRKFACGITSGGIMLLLTAVFAPVFGQSSIVKALIIALLGLFLSAAGSAIGSREPKRKRRR